MEQVYAFFASHAVTLITIVGAGALAALLLVGVVIFPHLIDWLKSLVDGNASSKISLRVKDALDKLKIVGQAVIESEATLYRQEILNALKDGQIDKQEIHDIAVKMSNKALEILKPELNTLKSYMAGEMVLDFVVAQMKAWMMQFATAKLGLGGIKVPFDSPAPRS